MVESVRRLDWPERLAAVIAEGERRAFSDEYYCVLFAGDAVLAMTDVDPVADYRSLSMVEAYRLMREREYETLRAATSAVLGPEIGLAFARRGDVVLRLDGDREALGVCCGEQSAFISSEGGIAWWPTLELEAAWRV
jgi:hypothetical protein